MTEQSPLEPYPITDLPTAPGNSDQTFQAPAAVPGSATMPADLEQTQQHLPLARRRVSATTAALVFLVFLLLAMVSVGGWALLHRSPVDMNAESSQTQPIQTAPTAQIVSVAVTDATASPMSPTSSPATAPASTVAPN